MSFMETAAQSLGFSSNDEAKSYSPFKQKLVTFVLPINMILVLYGSFAQTFNFTFEGGDIQLRVPSYPPSPFFLLLFLFPLFRGGRPSVGKPESAKLFHDLPRNGTP